MLNDGADAHETLQPLQLCLRWVGDGDDLILPEALLLGLFLCPVAVREPPRT